MRALGKFAVKVLLAICVFICSRAVLAVAHALGWFPEQQLANLILAAPTALQIEVVMWSMLAFVVVGSLLLVDYLVHGRNYRKMWTKIRTKLLKAPAAFMKLLDYFVVGAEPVRTPTVRKRQITIE